MIYDPKSIFGFIFDVSTDIPTESRWKVATDYALALVEERMMELRKTELWDDLWGPGRHQGNPSTSTLIISVG